MARTVMVSSADATLFHVAAAATGDALLAWRLAAASGIADPWLITIGTVSIPDGPTPPGNGLPPY